MSADYLAYTYLLGWIDQDRWYYGLRYENIRLKRTPEEDFWFYYKSSSKPVKQMLSFIGYPDYMAIDKTFESIEEAIDYENKILNEMDVLHNDEWLNKSNNLSLPNNKGKNHPMYGKNHSEKTKQKIGNSSKNRKHSEETKTKISKSLKGNNHSEETKIKLRKENSGSNNPMFGKKGKENPNYGKVLSDKHKEKLRKAKNKKVEINGVIYESMTVTAEIFEVKRQTINYWIKVGKNNARFIS